MAFAAPWQAQFEVSKLLPTAVVAVHLTVLLVGRGFAIAADHATLRQSRAVGEERKRQLAELRAVHRPVRIALGALFVSGRAVTAADVASYLVPPIYRIKSGSVVLLLFNGASMTHTKGVLRKPDRAGDSRAEVLWRRMRWSAWSRIALWIANLVLGTALVNNA